MMQANVNGDKDFKVSFKGEEILLNDVVKNAEIAQIDDHSLHVLYEGHSVNVFVEGINREEKQVLLKVNGKRATISLTTEMDLLLKKMGLSALAAKKATDIKAPMPGLIHSISVSVGDEVAKGDVVLILEAMKMENVIKSPTDGVVKKIAVEPGQSVDKNQLMIAFE